MSRGVCPFASGQKSLVARGSLARDLAWQPPQYASVQNKLLPTVQWGQPVPWLTLLGLAFQKAPHSGLSQCHLRSLAEWRRMSRGVSLSVSGWNIFTARGSLARDRERQPRQEGSRQSNLDPSVQCGQRVSWPISLLGLVDHVPAHWGLSQRQMRSKSEPRRTSRGVFRCSSAQNSRTARSSFARERA